MVRLVTIGSVANRGAESAAESRFRSPPVSSPFEIFWIAGTAGAKIGQLLNGLAESLKPLDAAIRGVSLLAQTSKSRSGKVLKNFAKGSRL